MSRDGLLGGKFSSISRFQTPGWATVVVGLFVAILSATIDIGTAAELTNIGTLFAFVLVAIGIWILREKQPQLERKFKVPAYKVVCSLCVLICGALMMALPGVTWWRFVLWMVVGVLIYFAWGYRKSKLQRAYKSE